MATRNKRQHVDNESDSDTERSENWAKFITLSTFDEEEAITTLSPFVIQKTIQGIIGEPLSIKKMRNKTLLVEVKSKKQSLVLQSKLKFAGMKVIGSPSSKFNRSKGVLRDRERDLRDIEEAEIAKELKTQGVLFVKRIKIKKNGNLVPTNTYILDFDTPNPPERIKIGYYSSKIEPFIPNPLRCFNCQKFGHSANYCKNPKVCFRCSLENCSSENCKNEPKCINCNEDHPSSSKNCSIWKKEKEIQKLKVEKRLSYPDARKLYSIHHPSVSYASVLKKKTTKEIACQTDFEMTSPKEVDCSPISPDHVDSTLAKQAVSASSTSQVPPKPSEPCVTKESNKEPEQIVKKDSVSPKKPSKTVNRSDRVPKGERDPISVHNRYGILEEETMDTSTPQSRTQSVSPQRNKGRIKRN